MLRPIKSKARRRRVVTYDLEWIPHSLEFRLGGVYDGETYQAFSNVPAMLNYMLSPEYSGAWFYAHAGGLYDVQFFLEYLIEHGRKYKIEAFFSGSSAIIVKITDGRHNWIFADSFWLLRSPLRKIGDMMGLPKGNVEEDVSFFETASFETLRDYNKRDCEILHLAIREFEETILELGGMLQLTAASTGMNLFRRQYLTRPIKTSDAVNAAARKAYVASRVEPHTLRCERAEDYDINSSFPHSMRRIEHPGSPIGTVRKIPKAGPFLAHVCVNVPDMSIPPLPYRTKDGRVYFPVGAWDTWIMRPDLEALELAGARIEAVYEVIRFRANRDLAGYAEKIYSLRQASKSEAYRYILKILLNSLYGKFAEREEKERVIIHPDTTPEGGRFIMPGVWAITEERPIAHVHVPFSCSITADARLSLYRHTLEASEVYYMDTDGFLCDPDTHYDTGPALGELKHEASVIHGEFIAPKMYGLEKPDGSHIVRAKGFRKLTYAQLLELREGAVVEVERMARIKENLKSGRIAPIEFTVKKQIRGKVRPKRSFYSQGGSRPWHVSELD